MSRSGRGASVLIDLTQDDPIPIRPRRRRRYRKRDVTWEDLPEGWAPKLSYLRARAGRDPVVSSSCALVPFCPALRGFDLYIDLDTALCMACGGEGSMSRGMGIVYEESGVLHKVVCRSCFLVCLAAISPRSRFRLCWPEDGQRSLVDFM